MLGGDLVNPDTRSDIPIFIQIAAGIEDSILTEIYPEESQIPSTTEISMLFKINPATVLKGMNILVEEGTIYKKRGLGMFVSTGATEKIKEKRKKSFRQSYVTPLLEEAEKLGFSKEDLHNWIEEVNQNAGN